MKAQNESVKLRQLKKTMMKFVTDYNKGIPTELIADLTITEADVNASVFEVDKKLVISGEEGNNFSLFFVNYWDGMNQALKFADWMNKHGWLVEWQNAGGMNAVKCA